MDERKRALPPVAARVLGYLAAHPEAEDTLEGIAEWWILETTIREKTEEVGRALAELVEQGLLAEVSGTSAAPRYRLVRERFDDIRRLIDE
jgi:hypothetical protein